MISEVPFQTRARTVDHLGREQIADTPTAISELWKNAYDAYARNVELNIFGGSNPVAVMTDDGHGMSRADFIDRWLVVGTESKATGQQTPAEDRNGLPVRTRQGQKGIGRLSCANLGPILLLVSKRRQGPFVMALVDWRLFENPFLNLVDVLVPVLEFETPGLGLDELPALVGSLRRNVEGDDTSDRGKRIKAAWQAYDTLWQQDRDEGRSNRVVAPSREILESTERIDFQERHLRNWSVWNGIADCGTALLISDINFDLRAQLDDEVPDASAKGARDRFFETLASFVDPFTNAGQSARTATKPDFHYVVRAWNSDLPKVVVGSDKQFDRTMIDAMEHQLDGHINEEGIFVGRIKAFGVWIEGTQQIDPPRDLVIPRRGDTRVGPCDIYIASMEFTSANTTHTSIDFQRYRSLAERYSGFMIFRDGLRVLPYGRTDNDFFEIESRRSMNAGREFWNHRQMFGRVAITRLGNPNLKDKAGREGLLDNRAAKTLKLLVANILMQSARQFFGSASERRGEMLPQIRESNEKARANEARNKLRQRQRQEFRSKLQRYSKELPVLVSQMEGHLATMAVTSEADLSDAQSKVEDFRENVSDFRLVGAPKSLGTLEAKFADYRDLYKTAQTLLISIEEELQRQVDVIKPAAPKELLEKQIARNAAQLSRRVTNWKKSIDVLQRAEFDRVRFIVADRNKLFHSRSSGIIPEFELGHITYPEATRLLDQIKTQIESENEDIFPPYISALESLKESIDLEHLATFGLEELSDLRTELERLNSLAQLGIAVEIVGHELQAYDDIVSAALRQLSDDIRDSAAVKDIVFGYEGLADQLRFLSPLRLAGQKVQRWVTGGEIYQYVFDFFRVTLVRNHIEFSASSAFRHFRVFDQPSRLLPVFINLVNNSIYWLGTGPAKDRRIVIDVRSGEVVISDNGPGIEAADQKSLFNLFFTRKTQGGRGVGLYLSRANLTAGGHQIRYQSDGADMPLGGANFVICFRGAEFDVG